MQQDVKLTRALHRIPKFLSSTLRQLLPWCCISVLIGAALVQSTARDPFMAGHVNVWLSYVMLTCILVLAGLTIARRGWVGAIIGALLSSFILLAIQQISSPGGW